GSTRDGLWARRGQGDRLLANDLWQRPPLGHGNRAAARQRLQGRQPEALEQTREDDSFRTSIERRNDVAGDVSEVPNAPLHAKPGGPVSKRFPASVLLAGEQQVEVPVRQ